MWLGRSGQCPLSISLQSGPENYSPPVTPSTVEPRSGEFLQALVPFAPRWQNISFTLMLEDMVHLSHTDMPMLERVVLRFRHRFPPLPVQWELFDMLQGPRLSSFSTSGNSFIPEKIPLRWHQLTDLTVDGVAWHSSMGSETVLQTLSWCPELRSCRLAVNDNLSQDTHLVSMVELPFLHTLELDFGSAISTLPILLDRLSLPELKTFSLHGLGGSPSSFSLTPFFASCTRLEHVNIGTSTFKFSRSCLLDSLRNLPSSLRRLDIMDFPHVGPGIAPPCLDDEALTVLLPCCPALEYLHIRYCDMISDAAFLKFITERMTGEFRAALKDVYVQFNRAMTLDILPSLAPFIETGINISVNYTPAQPSITPFSPWQGLGDGPQFNYSRYDYL
ncbi:hypothetical protein B0H19DRAFT_1116461 [Mycena capillaripes]|nr:hypothetical protein B0H19DRAFT_1116461 [Mycena capillaripes]